MPSLLDELADVQRERALTRTPRCGVGRFIREQGIDEAEFDSLYDHAAAADIHALLRRRGYGLGMESVKRHSPLRTSDPCSCRSRAN